MDKYFITVRQSSVDPVEGWTATVAKQFAPKGAKSAVALGESEIYTTKQQAWTSIQKRVGKLDFENDEVSFNHEKVNSYEKVQQKVAEL